MRDDQLPGLDRGTFPHTFDALSSSFVEVLRRAAPAAASAPVGDRPLPAELAAGVVEGTTVLALTYPGGVVIAGDRRATAGHLISRKDMRKVFPADDASAIAISGVAGPAMELAKLFALELEHYEKVEGDPLSLEGKANRLAHMVRANLPMALQGLVVVPLFAGYERGDEAGRIFEYDPVGGRYLATDYAAAGSGSLVARGDLKRGHREVDDLAGALRLAVGALFDAAEEDSATGGPDLVRRIYPIVSLIDDDGYRELEDADVAEHVEAIVEQRGPRHIDA